MNVLTARPLKVFLCYSSDDKDLVDELYGLLRAESWLDVWLDKERLLPGTAWKSKIINALKETDVTVICLSVGSLKEEGFLQKQFRTILDVAQEKLENSIFVIPIRMENCNIPSWLNDWSHADFFPDSQKPVVYKQLQKSLIERAKDLGILIENSELPKPDDTRDIPLIKRIINKIIRMFSFLKRFKFRFSLRITIYFTLLLTIAGGVYWLSNITPPQTDIPTQTLQPIATHTFIPTITPLPTFTSTITKTSTPEYTPTITLTPTDTLTPTPAPVLAVTVGGCGKYPIGTQCSVRVGISWIPVNKSNKICVYVQPAGSKFFPQTSISYYPDRTGYTATAWIGNENAIAGQNFTIYVMEMETCSPSVANSVQAEVITITR